MAILMPGIKVYDTSFRSRAINDLSSKENLEEKIQNYQLYSNGTEQTKETEIPHI